MGHVGTMFLVEITTIPLFFPFVLISSWILDCSFQTISIFPKKTFTNCRQSPVSRHPFDWRRRRRQRRAALLLPSATAVLGPQCGSLRGAKAGRALWGNGVGGALRVEIDCKHLERVEMFEITALGCYLIWLLYLILVEIFKYLQVEVDLSTWRWQSESWRWIQKWRV